MDGHRFDRLTRTLAADASRRGLLKALAGGMFGGAAGLLGHRGTGAADKVFICHNTGSATNPQVLIHVSVNAIPAHEAHGDLIGVDVTSDPFNCGDCGVVCEDNNACTENLCVDGECAFPAIVCDDGIACTVDTCDPATGCVFTPDDSLCDDGVACTVDVCDPGSGGCVNTPDDTQCDDGVTCTVDTCDPATGCVFTPDDTLCDDANACTSDACDPATGCVNTPIVCNDNDPCTTDTCDRATGCVFTPIICPEGTFCEDGFCQCEQIFVCGDPTILCGTGGGGPPLDVCICTGRLEGGTGCGNNFFCDSVPACTTSEECVAVFGPGAFCQDAVTGCCGANVCVPPCGVVPATIESFGPTGTKTNVG